LNFFNKLNLNKQDLFCKSGFHCKKSNVLQAYKAAAYPWLTSALAAIPEQAATQADKQSVITAAQSLAAGVDNRW